MDNRIDLPPPGGVPGRHTAHHRILIVGGGAAEITAAASLRRKRPDLDVAIVDPADMHWYQPAFTLVGAGVFKRKQTERPEASLIPPGVTWYKQAATAFLPEKNAVKLVDGKTVGYDYLIACPGLQLDWDEVEGLRDALGTNGVCSNYLPQYAEYTWRCIQEFKGGNALFTQPPMPIKCAGAPQKIMYLAADYFRKHRLLDKANIEFCLAGAVLFGVPYFVPSLEKAVAGYGINVRYKHNLRAVDAKKKIATFGVYSPCGWIHVTKPFDMIHCTPPQSAPDFVKKSPLANDLGWIDVNSSTLRHVRYGNIFALGDAAGTTNAKTAAAVRMQAPVVVRNLLALIDSAQPAASYDGYGSCPLTVGYGKIVLAEFSYGGKVTPSFPLDPRVPRTSMWYLKTKFLPWLYWHHMFHGGEFDIGHHEKKVARNLVDYSIRPWEGQSLHIDPRTAPPMAGPGLSENGRGGAIRSGKIKETEAA